MDIGDGTGKVIFTLDSEYVQYMYMYILILPGVVLDNHQIQSSKNVTVKGYIYMR